MSDHEDLKKWITNTLSNLPIRNVDLFSQLWLKKKLSYYGSFSEIDVTDEYNSRLICYALDKKSLLLLILPDDKSHRGALMLSTALLRSAVNQISKKAADHTVLYYGTSVAFKNSLANTAINGIYLDSVFGTAYMSRTYKKEHSAQEITSKYLPKVVCVYHPAQPEQFIQIYKPDWIAIDCSKENEIEWVSDLLTYCEKKGLPVIAWSQNNFSSVISEFERHNGKVFYSLKQNNDGLQAPEINMADKCIINPVVLGGEGITEIDELFKKAKLSLRRASFRNEMKVKSDAIKATWKYLRTLEKLIIPLSIYNEEAKAFWKTYSLREVREGVERYITLIEQYDHKLSSDLTQCFQALNHIYDKLEKEGPPYWSVLSNYCMDRSDEGSLRVIIFPSRTEKQLFSYTLLSKCNISESELFDDSRIILRTIKWFTEINEEDKEIVGRFQKLAPIFIGLPEYYNNTFFYQSVNKFETRILIYPHQLETLSSIIAQYNKKDHNQLRTSVQTLELMTGIKNDPSQYKLSERYLLNEHSQQLTIIKERNSRIVETQYKTVIGIADLHTELARLLENKQEEEDPGYLVNISINKDQHSETEKTDSFLVENSIKFLLEDDHLIIIDPNDELNLIKGKELMRIYARAVKVGDLILCIQNQVKKNLFDLLIERINDHRSLSIHLNLLQKWREEFYLSYMIWKDASKGNSLHEFWRLLQKIGSDVVSPLTISNWLHGYTLRPQDSMNIQRVGQILNNSFIKDHHQEIAKAASRIVGLHISLSSKLKRWLDGTAYDLMKDDMTIVDEELNLTLGELRGSMKILKVTHIEILKEPTLRNSLGVLQNNKHK